MKKINRNRIMAILISGILSLSLIACRKDTEEVIAVDAEITEESSEEISEEISTEAETIITYVEENGLTFTDETKVQTQGILSMPDNTDADIITVDWEIANINISINDTEDDVKIITIEQNVYGYIWSDGNIYKTNLNLPSTLLCDSNSGKVIPMITESTTTEIEWEEEKYSIETIEEVSWEDGSSSDWVEDPNGGERLSSTLKVTDTIKISKDYDGLALILLPITSTDSSIVGNYIMDVWSDGSYLFSINDLSAKFVADAEEVEETETDEVEVAESAEETVKEETNTKPSETTATTAPKEEHKHSYTSTDSPGTCTVEGIRTYTCTTCGYSYTENLGYGDHNYVASTQEIYHDEEWSVVSKTIKVPVFKCGCGLEFSSEEEMSAHAVASIEAGDFRCGTRRMYYEKTETVYDNVKISDSWTETITTWTCSVCGKTKN